MPHRRSPKNSFWRSDPNDLIGRTWLCTIRPDGTDLKVVQRIGKSDLGCPADYLAVRKRLKDNQLPGIPSPEGGVCTPEGVSQLQDGTYAFGYYDGGPHLGLAGADGQSIRRLTTYRIVRKRKRPIDLFGDMQWRINPDGVKGFWFGPGKRRILLQRVTRTEDGGTPNLAFVDVNSGEVVRQIYGRFLEDVDGSRTSFLTSDRRWGKGFGRTGTVPLQTLSLTLGKGGPKQISVLGTTCHGACFIPTGFLAPQKPNSQRGVFLSGPGRFSHDILFAARQFGEKLGNVYPAGSYHLYRIHPDGSGFRRLTSGRDEDTQPYFDHASKKIFFWRLKMGSERYRLCSIKPDGSSLHQSMIFFSCFPSSKWIPAVLENSAHHWYKDADQLWDFQIRGPNGKIIDSNVATFPSPDGSHAIVRENNDNLLIDYANRKAKALPKGWQAPSWISSQTIVALKGREIPGAIEPTSGEIGYFDLSGTLVSRKSVIFPSEDYGILPQQGTKGGSSIQLGRKDLFLWQDYNPFSSDGGFGYIHLLDLKSNRLKFLAYQSFEGVSPDGSFFLASAYDWVGGYKGLGAQKLGVMNLWTSKTLAIRPIGFRRGMIDGACFVPN